MLVYALWDESRRNYKSLSVQKLHAHLMIVQSVLTVLFFASLRLLDANSFLTAVASNRPTEALASVISFTFVVYSHYKHFTLNT